MRLLFTLFPEADNIRLYPYLETLLSVYVTNLVEMSYLSFRNFKVYYL